MPGLCLECSKCATCDRSYNPQRYITHCNSQGWNYRRAEVSDMLKALETGCYPDGSKLGFYAAQDILFLLWQIKHYERNLEGYNQAEADAAALFGARILDSVSYHEIRRCACGCGQAAEFMVRVGGENSPWRPLCAGAARSNKKRHKKCDVRGLSEKERKDWFPKTRKSR